MKTATRESEATVLTTTTDRRPFVRLEPRSRPELSQSVHECLPVLEQALIDDVPALVQALVNYAVGARHKRKTPAQRNAPSVSALNRCRRAARQWITAILAGDVDAATLHAVGHGLIPQLAGTGPELHLGEQIGSDCVEFLRGAATACIMAEPGAVLIPQAKALHALESILAIHLDAFEQAAAQSREAAHQAD